MSEASNEPAGDTVEADRSQPATVTEVAEFVPELPGPELWSALGWTLLLMLMLNGTSIAVAVALLMLGFEVDEAVGVLFLCSSLMTTLLAGFVAGVAYAPNIKRKLALVRPAPVHVALASLLVGPLGVVVQEIAAGAGEVLPSLESVMYEKFAAAPWPLVILGGCILPALGEEIFFRGFLGRGLVARLGPWWGIGCTSLLFALVHLDPPQIVGILFVGLALHGILLASRSLWVPMLVHFLNNLMSFGSEKWELYSMVEHLPPLLVATGAAALIPVVLLFWQSRSRWVRPDGSPWTPGYVSAEAPPEAVCAGLEMRRTSRLLWVLATILQALFWGAVVGYA